LWRRFSVLRKIGGYEKTSPGSKGEQVTKEQWQRGSKTRDLIRVDTAWFPALNAKARVGLLIRIRNY